MHASLVLLYLHEDVCPLQAWVPTPASTPALVGKAVAIIVPSLALAVHALWVRPFAAAHAWKSGVRAALLVLAAACAAAVAWAGALDLRLLSGPRAVASLTAGSYVIAVLFCIVIAVLVGGVAHSMLQGVRAEAAAMRMRLLALPVRAPPKRRPQRGADAPLEPAVGAYSEVAQGLSRAGCAPPRALPDAASDSAFAAHPARRPGSGATRRRRRGQPPQSVLRDSGLTAVASLLSDASASNADVVVACDAAIASLGRVPVGEVQAASAALLPGLSTRLATALRMGDSADSSEAVSLCGAMAALSDHADAATLSRLVEAGVPGQLAGLRLSLRVRGSRDQAAAPSPALTHALWLLGNVAADQDAAAAFTEAGGALLLVELLSFPPGADASLHVCVALASVSAHADAAAALLDAGVLSVLAPFLLQPGREEPGFRSSASLSREEAGGVSAAPDTLSVADAEAACRALANVLRPCVSSEGRTGTAAKACCELAAAEGVIAGLTAALRLQQAATDTSTDASLPVEPDGLSAAAVEALLCLIRCAAVVLASPPASPPSECTRGFPAVAALVRQAAEAGTAEALQALLDSSSESVGPALGALTAELEAVLARGSLSDPSLLLQPTHAHADPIPPSIHPSTVTYQCIVYLA